MQEPSKPPAEPILVEQSVATTHTTDQLVELLAGEAPEIGRAAPLFAPKIFRDLSGGHIAEGELCPPRKGIFLSEHQVYVSLGCEGLVKNFFTLERFDW